MMAIGEAATINPSSQVRDAGRGNSEQRSHVHVVKHVYRADLFNPFSRPAAAGWASAACGDRVAGKPALRQDEFPVSPGGQTGAK
jgi:hypothetical protein